MKKTLIILVALLTHSLAAEEAPPNPFRAAPREKPGTGIEAPVSRMDLDTHHNVSDAIQQIIAGLPPEARDSLVVDIPAAEIAKMPIKGELHVSNVPLLILMRYLEKLWPVGYKIQNNEIHICKERADDIIAVKYRITKRTLQELGIVLGPSQTFHTKSGGMWPPQSEWDASFSPLNPNAKERQDAGGPVSIDQLGVLKLRAARRYQEEFSAVLLLKGRGYETLQFER